MKTVPTLPVVAVVLILASLVGNYAVADDAELLREHGVELTAAGVEAYFAELKPDPAAQKKVAQWIAQLGDARFAVRETATRSLLEMPDTPLVELQAAAKSTEPETSARAKRILEHPQTLARLQAAERRRETTAAVLRSIAEKPIVGAIDSMLDAAPYLDENLIELAGDAAAKAAVANELPAIRRALGTDSLPARIVAVRGLGKAGGSAIRGELEALLAAENPRLRLAAAHALAEQGQQSSLRPLVALIEADDVAVRARAVRILRAATGENYRFNPFARLDTQQGAIKRWRTWLAERGDMAMLRLPLVLKPLAEDLSNGLLVHYTFDRDAGGRVEDSSGHGRHGQSQNAVAFVARNDGRAIQFTGMGHHGAEGGHAVLPSIDFSKLQRFTIALWVRENAMTHEEGEAYITYGVDRGVGTEDALGVAHLNGSLIFRVGQGQVSVAYKPADLGRWMHCAMTFQDGRLLAYQDAQVVGQTRARVQTAGDQAALARHWWSNGAGTSSRFQGAIDDVRIYDRALSGEQIRLLVEEAK